MNNFSWSNFVATGLREMSTGMVSDILYETLYIHPSSSRGARIDFPRVSKKVREKERGRVGERKRKVE